MKTSWVYSLETEANRLLHCARQTAAGFYKLNNFIPLPTNSTTQDNIVILPDLPYLNIPRFWDQVKRIDVSTLPLDISPELVNQTVNLLKSTNLKEPDFSQVKQIWAKYQNQILDEIFTLIPHKAGQVSEIIIQPTSIGTTCSFNMHRKKGDPIILWIREGHGISSIVEGILTSLTRQDLYDQLNGLWQESEIIVDWLLTFSPLGNLLKKIDPHHPNTLTIKNTRSQQNATLLEKSSEFLKKIGAPSTDVSVIKNLSSEGFTPREKQVLDLLISTSPKPVTMDQIGDIIFAQNPGEYSLFAISKTIQRLRDKLEKNGISGSYIQTKRGEGYMLVN